MLTINKNNLNVRTLANEYNNLRAVKNHDGTTTISGCAIVFNQPSQPLPVKDQAGKFFIEYIDPKALDDVDFSSTLLLYGHDYNSILAREDSNTLHVSIDEHGLNFTANVPATTLGNDTRQNILSGNVKGCSFGFTIPADGERWARRDDGMLIHYVDKIGTVDELTLTPIPAYTQTSVQVTRSLRDYEQNKEENTTMNDDEKRASSVASTASAETSASSATSSVSASVASSTESLSDIVSQAVSRAVTSAVHSVRACNVSEAHRDDDDTDADTDTQNADADTDSDEIENDAKNNSASPASTASASSANSSASSAVASSATSSASSTATSSTTNSQENQNKGEHVRMIDITPNSHETRDAQEINEFGNFLRTKNLSDNLRDAAAGVGLSYGQVLIPKTFLPAEHEQYQFPRLEQYVKKVSAPTTTGQWSYFEDTTDVLETKEEFDHAKTGTPKGIKTVVWNLQTYAKKYPISKELISDSKAGVTPNWVAEIQSTIQELEDNTNDKLISAQFNADGVNKVTAKDAINDLKHVLNVNLKPLDSAAAQIVLSVSARDALDQLKDNFGRPLLQPDPTSATANRLFGKPVVVVPDELLGKSCEANAVVAPLGKAIVDFQNDRVTGQFLDNFDMFENILGIYVRKDVKAVRPDLINVIKLTDKSLAASNNTVATGSTTTGK